MNAVPVLPDSAPFSPSQRAWLNGFFAGLLTRTTGSPAAAANVAALLTTSPGSRAGAEMGASPAPAVPVEAEEEEFPWHDAALAMDERRALAEGKPVARQRMAAMAQLDCGACGYVCQTYSEA